MEAICQSQGDVNATCDDPITGYDKCKCTASQNYYLSPTSGCLKLEPLINCIVTNQYDYDLDMRTFYIQWEQDLEATYSSGTFFVLDLLGTTNDLNAYYFEDQGQVPGDANVTIRAAYDDIVNGLVYSESASLVNPSVCLYTYFTFLHIFNK